MSAAQDNIANSFAEVGSLCIRQMFIVWHSSQLKQHTMLLTFQERGVRVAGSIAKHAQHNYQCEYSQSIRVLVIIHF